MCFYLKTIRSVSEKKKRKTENTCGNTNLRSQFEAKKKSPQKKQREQIEVSTSSSSEKTRRKRTTTKRGGALGRHDEKKRRKGGERKRDYSCLELWDVIVKWDDICFKHVLPRLNGTCLLYTSPSPRDQRGSRMPSSA